MAEGEDWTHDEVATAVEAYLDYLKTAEEARPAKRDLYRDLKGAGLSSRSLGSIEAKFQNISAELQELGLPYIEGLSPRPHRQTALGEELRRRLRVDLLNQLDSIVPEVFSSPSQNKYDPGRPFPVKEWVAQTFGLQWQDTVVKYVTSGRLRHAAGETQPAQTGVFLLEGDLTSRFLDSGPQLRFRNVLVFARVDGGWTLTAAVAPAGGRVHRVTAAVFPTATFRSSGVASATVHPEHQHHLNTIIYGPPGTGKTYSTVRRALEICGIDYKDHESAVTEYRRLSDTGRVRFVTFHQSFSYEDFIEGIRPAVLEDSGQVIYEPRDGIFKEICATAASRRSGDGSVDAVAGRRFWKMSLGNTLASDSEIYERCIEESVIRLGWGSGTDFSDCDDRDAVYARLKESDSTTSRSSYAVTAVNLFKNQIGVGDLVVISDGNHRFRAIAEVTGEYEYLPEEYGQSRSVRWLATFDPSLPSDRLLRKAISQKTLYELREGALKLDELQALISKEYSAEQEPCVLIIDEINRANISKVFGELITLLEPDKRLGGSDERRVVLPYSREEFGVPSNLFLIGTMNTADRSIASLDIALRRRFDFVEMMPDPSLLEATPGEIDGISVPSLLRSINRRVEFLLDRDHTIGHSYFMRVGTIDELGDVFRSRVIPLLQEYFHGDLAKVAWALACGVDEDARTANPKPMIVAEPTAAGEALGDGSEFEDRLVCVVNPAFLSAQGEDLKPFLSELA